jgi:flagellar motor switch protein FliN/FliY
MSVTKPKHPLGAGGSESERNAWLQRLPGYSRSLLKIQIPVSVTLATTKRSIQEILELVPGSIIPFEKPYDDVLTLEVGDQKVAQGETVKVGDKFGLRLTSITLPGERFQRVAGRNESDKRSASPQPPPSAGTHPGMGSGPGE